MEKQIIPSLFDPHKFSVTEIFSNNNGKTSLTKVVGFVTSMICVLIFMPLVVYYLSNPGECHNILQFIDRTITYFVVSAGLMGVKSVTSAFGRSKVELTQIVKPEPEKRHEHEYEHEHEHAEHWE